MKSSADMSMIRLRPGATRAVIAASASAAPERLVPTQGHDDKAVRYAGFQLYTRHERRPLAQ